MKVINSVFNLFGRKDSRYDDIGAEREMNSDGSEADLCLNDFCQTLKIDLNYLPAVTVVNGQFHTLACHPLQLCDSMVKVGWRIKFLDFSGDENFKANTRPLILSIVDRFIGSNAELFLYVL